MWCLLLTINVTLDLSKTNIIGYYTRAIIRTPLYYKQVVWSQKCQKSYIPYLYNTDTSVKQTLGSVPLASVLKRFDCNQFAFWFLKGQHFKMLVTKVIVAHYTLYAPQKSPVQESRQLDLKLTCSMGKEPGKSSSKTARSGHGGKNMSCPNDKLEYKFFFKPCHTKQKYMLLTKHGSKWLDIGQFLFLHFYGLRQRPLLHIPRLSLN